MKKIIITLTIVTALASCNKDCTCDYNIYYKNMNTNEWYLSNSTEVTEKELCKYEGDVISERTDGAWGERIKYENCYRTN